MTKRTRLFLLVGAGILVVGLGTGLIASYMGGFQNLVGASADGPSELAFLPEDVRLVAFADVRDVINSEARQRLLHLQPDGATSRFEAETGINLETDIDHVVAALSDGEIEPDRALVLARGRFDQVRIEGALREQGGSTQEYRGTRLVTHPEMNIGIAFVEPGLVAIGSPDGVRRALDTRAGTLAGIRTNADVMRLVRDVGDGDAWAVARLDTLLLGAGALSPDLTSHLPTINWLSARGYVNGGIRATLRAETRDETAAQDLREVIRGFVALARMQLREHAEIADLLSSMQLDGQGRTVSLGFTVSLSMLDALGAMARQRQADAGPLPRPLVFERSPAPRE
jgi:hypothetical protein